MSYDEFLKTLKDAGIDTDPYLQFNIDRLFRYAREKKKGATPVLVQAWRTGGRSGGSCWGDSSEEDGRSEAVPATFAELDKALETVVPKITLLQYKRLVAAVVETGTECVSHYYGNRDDYAYQLVQLPKLYETLIEMKLLEP